MALPDVVIIGAGVVGAACAFYAARAGLSVTVLDRGAVGGGTTGVGQGAVLACDKSPGPALDLAIDSLRRWRELGDELGDARLDLSRRGGLAVAGTDAERAALAALAARQRAAGVAADELPADELRGREPLLAEGLAGGVHYPGDLRVDPTLATAHLLRASGAGLRCGVDVRGVELDSAMRVTAVRTSGGDRLSCGAVVNAAGVWAGEVSAQVGTPLPVTPDRGFLLVTEPLAATPTGHTVYAGSAVITGDRSGAVRIGATRERVGFDRTWSLPRLRELATRAIALFPFLADVRAVGAYRGFRPATPDGLPIIGPDPWIRGLFHACGHAGAGVGLAPATGALTARLLATDGNAAAAAPGGPDPFAFHPERFG
jgi:glycine/D-amino acid oxidase-like deaminating enzyme